MKNRKEARVWDDAFDREFFTPEEILASKARVQIISAVIEARKGKGLSQQQLAELCGVSRQTISAIEKGDYNPTINLCMAICKALGKTLDDLFWENAEN